MGAMAGVRQRVEGRIPFPTEQDGWDGYVVAQAKFRQRAGDAGRDGAWFLQQLEDELGRYADQARGRRPPDYLLLATNVVLTPVAGGFKDRVAARMERACAELGMSGWHVWAYDELRALLDVHEGVRRAYLGLLASGDVLHDAMAHLGAPEFERTIALFLQKELLADQYAKLGQAGHVERDKLPLGGVFVDLPMLEDPLDRGLATTFLDDPVGCVEHLVGVSGRRGARTTVQVDVDEPGESDGDGRVVLVGGPGQGKSTVGQFLCQLHRMALLEARDPQTLSAEARLALAAVRDCAWREKLPVPRMRRFPIRVPLNAFATALADEDGPDSLLAYLLQRLEAHTGEAVRPDHLRRWLSDYPWLIVLDGLDEVPLSSNREEVLAAIEAFWIDVAGPESDVVVLATTRPQGYRRTSRRSCMPTTGCSRSTPTRRCATDGAWRST